MLPERVWFLRASIFALFWIVFMVWSLYNVPILYKVKFKCVNSSYMRSKSSYKTELYPRVIVGPRGGQLGWEKQWGKFSIMGERAPGMLLRTNQFHKSFKCLSLIFLCAQSEASIYHAAFIIFLYRGVYLQTRLFVVPVWLMQESSQEKLKTIFYSCTKFGEQTKC